MRVYKDNFKPILDLFISIIAFTIFLPFFLIISIILILTTNSHPLFFQERPGKNERIFKIIKFKTMRDVKKETIEASIDTNRITKFGGFLRKYSLDEIPQLLNVIKGDMSIIGPRPLLVRYLKYYNDFQKQRHNVKPGITGWAQVNGRNTIDWDSRFEYDIWYVNNLSFRTDLKILWLTLHKIFNTHDVYNEDEKINEGFTGTNEYK